MPLFDTDNRLSSDACSMQLQDKRNKDISGYVFARLRADAPIDIQTAVSCHPLSRSSAHRNLWAWDGYGMNVNAVDNDTKLRLESEVTHTRTKMQLPKRIFTALPNLAVGTSKPEVEATLINPIDTSSVRLCDRLAEKSFDRFDPGVCTVEVDNVVPPWTRGGDSSRDVSRSDEFLTSLGYRWDGRVWRRVGGGGNLTGRVPDGFVDPHAAFRCATALEAEVGV
jgi:hypothetical protein